MTFDDRGLRSHVRTQRARRLSDEGDAIQETDPDQDVSAFRVRPSDLNPKPADPRIGTSSRSLQYISAGRGVDAVQTILDEPG